MLQSIVKLIKVLIVVAMIAIMISPSAAVFAQDDEPSTEERIGALEEEIAVIKAMLQQLIDGQGNSAEPEEAEEASTDDAGGSSNSDLPDPYESEGGLPESDSVWHLDVSPEEVEIVTGGPASIAGVELPGGETRGSIIIMLPAPNKVVAYRIDDLIPGANWHGAYDFDRQVTEEDWRALAQDRIDAMMGDRNCTSGEGCQVVDVLVVGAGPRVVDQWTINGESEDESSEAAEDTQALEDDEETAENGAAEMDTNNETPQSLDSDESYTYPEGTIISGDVEIDGEACYDNKESTRLVVILDEQAEVYAEWGASVVTEVPDDVEPVHSSDCPQ